MQTRYVRLSHTAASPCQACGKRYQVTDRWTSGSRKFCSVACKSRAQRKSETKQCVKCKRVRPYDAFALRASRVRASSCLDCFAPRTDVQVALCESKEPCRYCHKPYALPLYPSQMAKRMYCSAECRVAARTKVKQACEACRRELPVERFSYQPSGKARISTCEECVDERARLKEAGAGHRMSCGHMVGKAKALAAAAGLRFDVSEARIAEVYNGPCAMCGGKSCSMMPLYPDVDYTDDSVEGRCWMCSMFQRGRGVQVDDDVVVAHARAIVRWAER